MNKLQTSRIHIVVTQEVTDKRELIKTVKTTIYRKHYNPSSGRYIDADLSNQFVAAFASFRDAMQHLLFKI